MSWKLEKPFTPLRVGIDIDGCLGDFDTPYRAKLNEIEGHNPCPDVDWTEHPNCWSWETKYGYSGKTVNDFWHWANTYEGITQFWEKIPCLLSQAELSAVNYMMTHHDVYFITKRSRGLKEVSEGWIMDHIVQNGRMPTVILSKRKGAVAYGLSLHGMIDDKPDNLLDTLRCCGTNCVPFLFDQPWNREPFPNMMRIGSLQRAFTTLKELTCPQLTS